MIKKNLKIIHPQIEILSTEYINARSKLKCRCLECGYIWEVSYDSLRKLDGCKRCSILAKSLKHKLSIEEIKIRIKDINPNIEILSNEYINANSKLKCRCKIDGFEWNAKWNNLQQGKGCPKCGNKSKKEKQVLSLDEIKIRLSKINPNIKIISSTYINANTKIECQCLIDGNIWSTKVNHLLEGIGCPKCGLRIGNKNGNWKEGITPLHIYLRSHILQWKKDSMKKYNYKCDITQENFEVIHHANKNFNKILKETMSILNLPIYQEINKYTDKELKQIENKCLELHYKYGLGICLIKQIHKEFHLIYGKINNTLEQYYEFKNNKLKELNKAV